MRLIPVTCTLQPQRQRQGGGRQTATDRMQQRLRRRRQAAAQVAEGSEAGSGDEVNRHALRMPVHHRILLAASHATRHLLLP